MIVESITLLSKILGNQQFYFCTLTANADIIAKKGTVWYSSSRWCHMISTSPARFQKLQPKYRNYSKNITYFRRWIFNSGHYRRSCLHWSCGFWCFKCPIRVRAPLRKHRHNIGSRLFTNTVCCWTIIYDCTWIKDTDWFEKEPNLHPPIKHISTDASDCIWDFNIQ